MTTTKSLQLNFLNSENKKTTLTLPSPAANLTGEQIETAMAKIAQANVFNKEEVDLYHLPQSASYIERTVTELFTATTPAGA